MLQKLISWLRVQMCNIKVSISYFDQILGKRESQTWQLLNFAGTNVAILWFWNFLQKQNFAKIVKNHFEIYITCEIEYLEGSYHLCH